MAGLRVEGLERVSAALLVQVLLVGRVGGDDGELRPWHYIYVYSIESRLIMRVGYMRSARSGSGEGSYLRLVDLCITQL